MKGHGKSTRRIFLPWTSSSPSDQSSVSSTSNITMSRSEHRPSRNSVPETRYLRRKKEPETQEESESDVSGTSGYSSGKPGPAKRTKAEEIVEKSRRDARPVIKQDGFVISNQSSIFPSLHEDISMTFGRNNGRVNQSLNASFVSLGPIDLNRTLGALPEWIAEVHRKRTQAPSQIKAKVEYKTFTKPEPHNQNSDSLDGKLMPPPSGFATAYEKKIRIQENKDDHHDIRNWFLGFSVNGAAVIQGLDVKKQKKIKSTEIVSVKNQREISTTRSTYMLVGPLDKQKWNKYLPNGSEQLFENGFPDNWKKVAKIIKMELDGKAGHNLETDTDSESDEKQRMQRQEIYPQKQPAAIKLDSASIPWKELNEKKLQVALSRIEDSPKRHTDAASVEAKNKSDDSMEANEVDQSGPSRRAEQIRSIRLENWTIMLSGSGEDMNIKLADVVVDSSGRLVPNFEISMDEIVKKDSHLFVSKDHLIEYQLMGSPIFDETTPERVRRKFQNGFPCYYRPCLDAWRSSEVRKATTQGGSSRSGRCVKPTEKKSALNEDRRIRSDRKFSMSKETKKQNSNRIRTILKKPVSSSELSSDAEDSDVFKTTANTKKAAKIRADIKNRLKGTATFMDDDFFLGAEDTEQQTDDDLPMKTPVRKLKTAKKVMSPMAAFLTSHTEDEVQPESESDSEERAVQRDKRKRKAVEKFVYHEKMQQFKKKAPEKVLPKKPLPRTKTKSKDVLFMKTFLDQQMERKILVDQKLMFGEESDLSDFDD